MNERIKELAEQAGIAVWGAYAVYMYDPKDTLDSTVMAKFAELIVRECATAFEAEVDTWKEMNPYQGSIKRQGTKAIKKHFGVE